MAKELNKVATFLLCKIDIKKKNLCLGANINR